MCKYRLNRKDGLVYLDNGNNEIEPIGEHLDAVILWASPKFTDILFNMPRQQWVQLAVLTPQMQLGYFVLNAGMTGALYSWEHYVDYMVGVGRSLSSVVTRFGFENADIYFDYTFQPFDAPNFVLRSQQWLAANPQVSMVDESLPLDAQVKLNKMYRQQYPQVVQRKLGLIA